MDLAGVHLDVVEQPLQAPGQVLDPRHQTNARLADVAGFDDEVHTWDLDEREDIPGLAAFLLTSAEDRETVAQIATDTGTQVWTWVMGDG